MHCVLAIFCVSQANSTSSNQPLKPHGLFIRRYLVHGAHEAADGATLLAASRGGGGGVEQIGRVGLVEPERSLKGETELNVQFHRTNRRRRFYSMT